MFLTDTSLMNKLFDKSETHCGSEKNEGVEANEKYKNESFERSYQSL